MEDSKDLDEACVSVVPWTPHKAETYAKFYVRRKSTKLLNDSPHTDGCVTFAQVNDSSSNSNTTEEEMKNKTEECDKSGIPKSNSQSDGNKKKRNVKQTKPRYNRPRIMEEGRTPRNPATTRFRTTNKKRKMNENETKEEVKFVPKTPTKQTVPKKRKNPKTAKIVKTGKISKTRKKVARTLTFVQEEIFSCLDISRLGLNFAKGKERSPRCRFFWRRKSKRSNRGKNVGICSQIALSSETSHLAEVPFQGLNEILPVETAHPNELPMQSEGTMDSQTDSDVSILFHVNDNNDVAPTMVSQKDKDLLDALFKANDSLTKSNAATLKEDKRRMKNALEHLKKQIKYAIDHGLSSLADVPLHMEDTLMNSANDEAPNQPKKSPKDFFKIVKGLRKLNVKKRVTTLIKAKKKLVSAKVSLDPETVQEWELLMENDLPSRSYPNKETESKWESIREKTLTEINYFLGQMDKLQGSRKFKLWKGSVLDSIIGVFLTQNVSDYLSSNAFMSVAARFPPVVSGNTESLSYYVEEPAESFEPIFYDEGSRKEVGEHDKTAQRKNVKTGIIEDEQVDWEDIRRKFTKESPRDKMYMDAVNWEDVRLSGELVFATTIKQRGQFRILAGRISKFLNDEVRLNGKMDLEWLRNAPSDLAKRYLLEIEGIGLKSAECVRLLGLKHSAFPVDTNVGRIAVRLGWVPLEPLPDGVQMHQLFNYPSMDSIQKYLWPRLCKLPQEKLYELHYQMITFGKVFCTKVIPNCNACPMKSKCKYFASAYVSSKVLLEGSKEKPQKSDTFSDAYPYDVDANMTPNINVVEEYDSSNINLVEEYHSSLCTSQSSCSDPVVEFPSSPISESFESFEESSDIEDEPWKGPDVSVVKIPEIVINMDALKKNVEDAFSERRKMVNNCGDDELSKALVVLTRENACIPIQLPRKMKYYNRLRTEHIVYMLPDNHKLLKDFERREHDDPCPYLLAIWQPGEMSYSMNPPKKRCNSDGSILCKFKSCSYCRSIHENESNTYRGTILIPCRTANRGSFPLNGTYFQTNEVFADYETSMKPIVFPREWCNGLNKRPLYCGSSISSIVRFLATERIQFIFRAGFVCMRAFDRQKRTPKELSRRLHTQPDKKGKKHMQDFDE